MWGAQLPSHCREALASLMQDRTVHEIERKTQGKKQTIQVVPFLVNLADLSPFLREAHFLCMGSVGFLFCRWPRPLHLSSVKNDPISATHPPPTMLFQLE